MLLFVGMGYTGAPTHAGDEKKILIWILFWFLLMLYMSKNWIVYKVRVKKSTLQIRAVVTARKTIEWNWMDRDIRYNYTFSGLDQYKGISFYNKKALVRRRYEEGEEVELYINPKKIEEFWFKEEDEPSLAMVVLLFCVIMGNLYFLFEALSKY